MLSYTVSDLQCHIMLVVMNYFNAFCSNQYHMQGFIQNYQLRGTRSIFFLHIIAESAYGLVRFLGSHSLFESLICFVYILLVATESDSDSSYSHPLDVDDQSGE